MCCFLHPCPAGISAFVGPTVAVFHVLDLVHDISRTLAFAGISAIVGTTVTVVHVLALVHAVSCTLAVVGMSAIVRLTVAGVLNYVYYDVAA